VLLEQWARLDACPLPGKTTYTPAQALDGWAWPWRRRPGHPRPDRGPPCRPPPWSPSTRPRPTPPPSCSRPWRPAGPLRRGRHPLQRPAGGPRPLLAALRPHRALAVDRPSGPETRRSWSATPCACPWPGGATRWTSCALWAPGAGTSNCRCSSAEPSRPRGRGAGPGPLALAHLALADLAATPPLSRSSTSCPGHCLALLGGMALVGALASMVALRE
jgi:hypothetical protein